MAKKAHVVSIEETTRTYVVIWANDIWGAEELAEELMNASVINTVSGFHDYERNCTVIREADKRDLERHEQYDGEVN